MKRRGFLGLIAVAGPAAAKSAISVSAHSLSGPGSLAIGAGSLGMPDAPGNLTSAGSLFRKMDRAAQIKRWISGEEEPEEDFYDVARVRQLMAEQHVNALHSISSAAKVRIARREMTKHEREKLRKYWWKELLRLEGGDE
jgi:hypothetical protein